MKKAMSLGARQEMLWYAGNQICSKRLVPSIPDLVESLQQHGHLNITQEIKTPILSVSPATIDRLFKCERIKNCRGLTTTKPGTLLKNQISVRTFADWNEKIPGFFECDLVAHCGETTMGVFLNTLVMTDIVTTWTECIALIRKSSDDVILGLETASQLLPFTILGCDVDNGSEFINYDLFDYCKENSITFTRSRQYKKNDQAHVEQKNGVEAALPGPKLYRKTKKPTRPHDWKTRKHPLDDVMDFVELEVQLNPNTEPKIILEKLMQKYPGNFCQSHLRTLQRRLSEFREKENQREKKYQELTVNNKYMTTENIQVIIEPMVDSVICFESTTIKDGVIFQ